MLSLTAIAIRLSLILCLLTLVAAAFLLASLRRGSPVKLLWSLSESVIGFVKFVVGGSFADTIILEQSIRREPRCAKRP